MLTFDRLKIVASIDAIQVTDDSAFVKEVKEGVLLSMKYYKDRPNMLMIKIDFRQKEAVVEFTGKILGHDYPKLISIDNIRDCFRNIEASGFCTFDMDLIMASTVVSCDVTKDVPCADIKKIQSYIRSHISNYDRYVCRALKNGNIILEKNVTTRRIKKRMTIYDKEAEMQKTDNTDFMKGNGLTDEFRGMCRFEINLNTKEQIRNSLHICDTDMTTVLTSTANPIKEYIEEAVRDEAGHKNCSDWKSYQRYLVLKDCGFDLAQVEAKVRSLYKRGTKISDVMKPYRDAYEKLVMGGNGGTFSGLTAMLG